MLENVEKLSKHIKKNKKELRIFNKGGLPLTKREEVPFTKDTLEGGLIAAIAMSVNQTFQDEIHHMKIAKKLIIVKRTDQLMGSLVLDDKKHLKINRLAQELGELLEHIERAIPISEISCPSPTLLDNLLDRTAIAN